VRRLRRGIAIACLFMQKQPRCRAPPHWWSARSVWCSGIGQQERPPMSLSDLARGQHAVEECLDEVNDFLAALQHYPPTVLAVALRVHLETLLQALLQGQMCTREDVRDFVRELERDALLYEEANS
jgi:hypothetical protein